MNFPEFAGCISLRLQIGPPAHKYDRDRGEVRFSFGIRDRRWPSRRALGRSRPIETAGSQGPGVRTMQEKREGTTALPAY